MGGLRTASSRIFPVGNIYIIRHLFAFLLDQLRPVEFEAANARDLGTSCVLKEQFPQSCGLSVKQLPSVAHILVVRVLCYDANHNYTRTVGFHY